MQLLGCPHYFFVLCFLGIVLAQTGDQLVVPGELILLREESGVKVYHFCAPVNAKPNTEDFVLTTRFDFAEYFQELHLDFDYNSEGIDVKHENGGLSKDVQLSLFQDSQSLNGWNPSDLDDNTFSGLVVTDGDLVGVTFQVVTLTVSMEPVPHDSAKCGDINLDDIHGAVMNSYWNDDDDDLENDQAHDDDEHDDDDDEDDEDDDDHGHWKHKPHHGHHGHHGDGDDDSDFENHGEGSRHHRHHSKHGFWLHPVVLAVGASLLLVGCCGVCIRAGCIKYENSGEDTEFDDEAEEPLVPLAATPSVETPSAPEVMVVTSDDATAPTAPQHYEYPYCMAAPVFVDPHTGQAQVVYYPSNMPMFYPNVAPTQFQ